MNTPTIVINRYNEDLSWLKDVRKDPSIYIYNKGESLDATTIPYHSKVKDVPNIGRETEGYLRFMIEEYDTLQNDSYYIYIFLLMIYTNYLAHLYFFYLVLK